MSSNVSEDEGVRLEVGILQPFEDLDGHLTHTLMLAQIIDVHSIGDIPEHKGHPLMHTHLQIGPWIAQKPDWLQLNAQTLLQLDSLIDLHTQLEHLLNIRNRPPSKQIHTSLIFHRSHVLNRYLEGCLDLHPSVLVRDV